MPYSSVLLIIILELKSNFVRAMIDREKSVIFLELIIDSLVAKCELLLKNLFCCQVKVALLFIVNNFAKLSVLIHYKRHHDYYK